MNSFKNLIFLFLFFVLYGTTSSNITYPQFSREDHKLNDDILEVEPEEESSIIRGKRSLDDNDTKGNLTLGVYVITDYSFYQKWLDLNENNELETDKSIKEYLAYIFQIVDTIYHSLKTDKYDLTIKIVGIKISKTREEVSFVEEIVDENGKIDMTEVLKKLIIYKKKNKNLFPKHDSTLIFTNYNSGPSGMATLKTICKGAIGIIRDNGVLGTANTVAHELGHNLGSKHDGDQNHCNPLERFLMTPIHDGEETLNFWSFSKCSTNSINKYINELEEKNKNCLASEDKEYLKFEEILTKMPGKKYPLNVQCQQLYGKESKFCPNGALAHRDICASIYCLDPKSGHCSKFGSMRALDGTLCGNSSMCLGGECIKDSRAPKNNDYCIYGDPIKPIKINGKEMMCKDIERSFCYTKSFKDLCCGSCAKKEGPNKDCKYGDKFSNCKVFLKTMKKKLCLNRKVAKGCCETCNV